jgi:hypothetical protein
MYIVITGTPGEGFRFYGPFEYVSDAKVFARKRVSSNYSIEKLVNPKD